MEHEGNNYTNRDWCFWYNLQRIIKRTGGLGNTWMNGDHPNYNIFGNGQNIEKCPGNLRKLPTTQNPVKNHQLKVM